MMESSRDSDTEKEPRPSRLSIDEELLARAAEINDSIAGEFDERAVAPMDSAVLARMAELGVETEAAVSVAIQRAHRIAFYMHRGRAPRDTRELESSARELAADDRSQVAGLAVAWWDGVLTALRARELETRGHPR